MYCSYPYGFTGLKCVVDINHCITMLAFLVTGGYNLSFMNLLVGAVYSFLHGGCPLGLDIIS